MERRINSRIRESVEKAGSLIMENFASPLTIPALARKTGTNDCTLKWAFREIYKMTIAEYRLTGRMKQALVLLSDDRLCLQDIAEQLGYTESSNFSIAFKNYYGYPPNLYRKQLIPLQ